MTGDQLQELFSKVISAVGGEDVVPLDNVKGHYADFVFRYENPPIVAELKCLVEDSVGSKSS